MKFSIKPIDTTHPTLGMLLLYLEKLKIQFVCIYSANVDKCIHVAFCCAPIQIQTFYQNRIFVAEYHADC